MFFKGIGQVITTSELTAIDRSRLLVCGAHLDSYDAARTHASEFNISAGRYQIVGAETTGGIDADATTQLVVETPKGNFMVAQVQPRYNYSCVSNSPVQHGQEVRLWSQIMSSGMYYAAAPLIGVALLAKLTA